MYKNQLQELAQRSCFNLPAYTCLREGPDHAPRFKAAVNFNGEQFESPGFFTTLRQAEHAAAEVALAALARRGPSYSLAARILVRPRPPPLCLTASLLVNSIPRRVFPLLLWLLLMAEFGGSGRVLTRLIVSNHRCYRCCCRDSSWNCRELYPCLGDWVFMPRGFGTFYDVFF